MGDTRVTLNRQLTAEPDPAPHLERKRGKRKNIAVLLDNIRSAWNVGSILRSADGFGFTHTYLCGITPTADNEAVTKTSLGAQDSVPWSYHRDAVRLVKGLKVEGWKIFALEEDLRAQSISQFADHPSPNLSVLIIGNEVTGVDPDLLDLCDEIFYIPMLGEKKSFNVAIAFGIAAYALNARRFET
jgi:tRNA G18 (ribose-2'-O)-methylase SpoU